MQDKLMLKGGSLASTTSDIKAKMAQMESLFTEVKGETSKLKSFWDSPSGLITQIHLNELIQSFDVINEKNTQYIAFLNEMIEKYGDLDSKISSAVEGAAGTGL